jgi:hypothetical protein
LKRAAHKARDLLSLNYAAQVIDLRRYLVTAALLVFLERYDASRAIAQPGVADIERDSVDPR